MDKYLKMEDVFGSGVVAEQKLVGDAYELQSDSYGHICVVNTAERADTIAHAINSHDELVVEVERLRSENESLMKCRMAAREFFNCTVASGGLVKVSSSNKAALDEADKASDWLEIELKATADLVKK